MSGETFGALLGRLRVERGLSQNALARRAACGAGHINRLENAKRGAKVGRDVVLSLADGLELSERDRDRLLFVAGLAPERDWQTLYEDLQAALQTVRAAVVDIETIEEPPFIRRRTG